MGERTVERMAEWIVELGDGNIHIKKMSPLVRCKDCKFYQAQDPIRPTTCAVGLEDNLAIEYCSRGERREE